MENGTAFASRQLPPTAPTLAEGADLLARLSGALDRMQQAMVEAVALVGAVQRAGVAEIVEGLPLELFLALRQRMTSVDRAMLLEAARLLEHLPVTRQLFAQGAPVVGSGARDPVPPRPVARRGPGNHRRTRPRLAGTGGQTFT